jgi:nicotinamide-nucleotide amidase
VLCLVEVNMRPSPVIHLLMTGNELMSGVTVDSNSAFIAQAIEPLSLAVRGKVTVGDDFELLKAELARLVEASDVVLVNGGLGPTDDDLTAAVLAAVAGVPLDENAEALAHLEYWVQRRALQLNAANRKQALLPRGVELIPNPTGSAVGFQLRIGDCDVLCTPGIPSELRRMTREFILPWLAARFPAPGKLTIERYQVFGLGESTLQQLLSDGIGDWPAAVELGFRAGAPLLELKLTSRDAEHDPLREHCAARVRELIGDHIVGVGGVTLPQRVHELLAAGDRRLTTAESCTGGLIASMLTEVPGASAVFEAGFVTYSNAMKQEMLGVRQATLAEHGAVSEAVVLEMARGALERSGADCVIAVSGVAGPEGGSEDKPVGLVWLCWGAPDALQTRALHFPFGRRMFQTFAAATGLDLVRRHLQGLEQEPRYFRDRAFRPPPAA